MIGYDRPPGWENHKCSPGASRPITACEGFRTSKGGKAQRTHRGGGRSYTACSHSTICLILARESDRGIYVVKCRVLVIHLVLEND